MSLSDLRVPLLWRPADHLKDTGDSRSAGISFSLTKYLFSIYLFCRRRFALFLIARTGAQIYDTGLVYHVDR